MVKIKGNKKIDLLQSINQFHLMRQFYLMEALGGFEPPNQSFADSCLTTWLQRRMIYYMHEINKS